MLDRRQLLISAGATALVACTPKPEAAVGASEPAEQLKSLFEAFFNELLDDSPETVTRLGLDKGERAAAKARLDDVSLQALARDKARTADWLKRLKAIDRTKLTGSAAVQYDTELDTLETESQLNRFAYGYAGIGQPYVVTQMTGAYQDVPDFLGTAHVIEAKADADAYLSRLEAFATVLDQETERVRHDAGLGAVPPDFVVERSRDQLKGLIGPAQSSVLVTSLAERAKARGIEGDYAGQAAKLYAEKVVPALQRQIALMEEIRPKATHDMGAWKLPDGEAYYRAALRGWTTTNLSPDEIHQMGLDQARELSARADVILKGQGYTQGTVAERIQALYRDKRHQYPNTDAAKEQLIADLNAQIREISARLPEVIGRLPKAPVEVRRVPKYIEAGAPGGYYDQPSLDGSRPGIYWINLRDTAEWPKWSLPTLTYHEASPGHHNQVALQQEADLPMLLRVQFNSAYAEGWGLYAEQLAQEMGVYADNPLGEVGYLQSALFRSARLVVDTGIHHKRWSREQAIKTMTSIDGSPVSAATTEIERYFVLPGQACSYMVGKLTFVRLREKARAALGQRFDLRRFHDTVLQAGSPPLTVLERVVDDLIATSRA